MFVYTSSEQTKNEIKKTIPFYNSMKKNKYLETNLTKKILRFVYQKIVKRKNTR